MRRTARNATPPPLSTNRHHRTMRPLPPRPLPPFLPRKQSVPDLIHARPATMRPTRRTLALALTAIALATHAAAQPFTVNESTEERSYIPMYPVGGAIVSNQVRERERGERGWRAVTGNAPAQPSHARVPAHPLPTHTPQNVPLGYGSTFMNNVASGAWAAPRTSITASQDNFYESCPSQALRLALPGGPCADAIPAIKPFSAGMVTAECRVVAMAMRAQPAPFPPKCCPLLRQFIGDGCACESATLFVSPIGNVSAVDLVAATRAAQVSFCASDEYGGPMHNPCRNIKSCETYAQLGQKTPAKPVAPAATATAAPVVKPAAVTPGPLAAPVGGAKSAPTAAGAGGQPAPSAGTTAVQPAPPAPPAGVSGVGLGVSRAAVVPSPTVARAATAPLSTAAVKPADEPAAPASKVAAAPAVGAVTKMVAKAPAATLSAAPAPVPAAAVAAPTPGPGDGDRPSIQAAADDAVIKTTAPPHHAKPAPPRHGRRLAARPPHPRHGDDAAPAGDTPPAQEAAVDEPAKLEAGAPAPAPAAHPFERLGAQPLPTPAATVEAVAAVAAVDAPATPNNVFGDIVDPTIPVKPAASAAPVAATAATPNNVFGGIVDPTIPVKPAAQAAPVAAVAGGATPNNVFGGIVDPTIPVKPAASAAPDVGAQPNVFGGIVDPTIPVQPAAQHAAATAATGTQPNNVFGGIVDPTIPVKPAGFVQPATAATTTTPNNVFGGIVDPTIPVKTEAQPASGSGATPNNVFGGIVDPTVPTSKPAATVAAPVDGAPAAPSLQRPAPAVVAGGAALARPAPSSPARHATDRQGVTAGSVGGGVADAAAAVAVAPPPSKGAVKAFAEPRAAAAAPGSAKAPALAAAVRGGAAAPASALARAPALAAKAKAAASPAGSKLGAVAAPKPAGAAAAHDAEEDAAAAAPGPFPNGPRFMQKKYIVEPGAGGVPKRSPWYDFSEGERAKHAAFENKTAQPWLSIPPGPWTGKSNFKALSIGPRMTTMAKFGSAVVNAALRTRKWSTRWETVDEEAVRKAKEACDKVNRAAKKNEKVDCVAMVAEMTAGGVEGPAVAPGAAAAAPPPPLPVGSGIPVGAVGGPRPVGQVGSAQPVGSVAGPNPVPSARRDAPPTAVGAVGPGPLAPALTTAPGAGQPAPTVGRPAGAVAGGVLPQPAPSVGRSAGDAAAGR